jgi:hypothetical protein
MDGKWSATGMSMLALPGLVACSSSDHVSGTDWTTGNIVHSKGI